MAYAIASLATASGGAMSAEGAIHYSGLINFKFQNEHGIQKHPFPLSQGVVLTGVRSSLGGDNASATFFIKGAAVSNAFRTYGRTSFFPSSAAASLPRGTVISQGPFGFPFGTVIGRLQDYDCEFPDWQEPGAYYLGFRFDGGAGKQYGWVRIRWGGCGAMPNNNEYVVKDYAWGDPGDKIKAGQKRLKDDEANISPAVDEDAAPAVDSQGSLGLLALGAVGLQAWRKSRFGRVSSDADAP
jgi:hypothetical protein